MPKIVMLKIYTDFCIDYRVALLSKRYLTAKGIIPENVWNR